MHMHDSSDQRNLSAKELVAPTLFLAGLFTLIALISTLSG